MKIEPGRVPVITAVIHAVLFAATVVYVHSSTDGQAPLVWVLWIIPDFPVSLLYLVGPAYTHFVDSIVAHAAFMDYVLYMPHLVHGLLGTIWWYVMPRSVIALFLRFRARRVQT